MLQESRGLTDYGDTGGKSTNRVVLLLPGLRCVCLCVCVLKEGKGYLLTVDYTHEERRRLCARVAL